MNQQSEQGEQKPETLLVFDKEEQSIQAIKSLDKNGKLNTVSPTDKHNADFIRLDKSGNFLSNFYTNFVHQLNDPSRLRLFKIPIANTEFFAETIKSIIKDSTPAGEAMLSTYEVKDPTLKQSDKELNISKQTNPNKKQEKMEQSTTASNYRYKVEDIDWKTMNAMGITQEKLQDRNLLDDLLRGFKTKELVPINLNLGTAIARSEARLSLQLGENGKTVVMMHGVRKEPTLHYPFFGHTFTQEDKKNLLETGNMGRIVHLDNLKTGGTIPSIISLDRLTNELVALSADKIKVPDEIKGVKLSQEQRQTLLEGKPLFLDGMISNKGKEFSANVQFNADKRYVEFLFDRTVQKQSQRIGEAPRFIRGKELSDAQYEQFKKGETIYVNDLVDKKGQSYKGYLTYNIETGRTSFSFQNPDTKKKAVSNATKQNAQADEAHKTQIAVNSEGKTNEATKNVKEPLKKGQTAPTDSQLEEQKQKKSRGRKM